MIKVLKKFGKSLFFVSERAKAQKKQSNSLICHEQLSHL